MQFRQGKHAAVAKLADARDLNSFACKAYRFKSGQRHHSSLYCGQATWSHLLWLGFPECIFKSSCYRKQKRFIFSKNRDCFKGDIIKPQSSQKTIIGSISSVGRAPACIECPGFESPMDHHCAGHLLFLTRSPSVSFHPAQKFHNVLHL